MSFTEAKGSSEAWAGWSTVTDAKNDPYMFRLWVGRLRLHVFYRGDADPDCHDHPWDFWTFPLTPYVEEVVVDRNPYEGVTDQNSASIELAIVEGTLPLHKKVLQVVPAFRLSFRPATHCHRVLGRWNGRHMRLEGYAFGDPEWPCYDSYDAQGDPQPIPYEGYYPQSVPGKIVTLVWRSEKKRSWGFLKNRDGKWCWVAWRDYVFHGGEEGPCQ